MKLERNIPLLMQYHIMLDQVLSLSDVCTHVYAHACVCVHVCEYIHPHTYAHVAVILNVIQPKRPELSNFLFLPPKHLHLGSSQSNDNALKWL